MQVLKLMSAGLRKLAGKPLLSGNTGCKAVDASEMLLLMKDGGFSAS